MTSVFERKESIYLWTLFAIKQYSTVCIYILPSTAVSANKNIDDPKRMKQD